VESPSTRFVALAAGAVLIVAGSALALVAAKTLSPSAPSATATTVAQSSSTLLPGDPPSTVTTALGTSQTPRDTSTTTVPEPPWRIKQREAEQRILTADDGAEAVGVVALISFDTTVTTAPPPAPTPAASSPPTRIVLDGGATPLKGIWAGTAEELADYLTASQPSPGFTVPPLTLARYYIRWAGEVGLRADILWAQMLHETGFGAYGGDVGPTQNNFAGIGATGGGAVGYSFPTAEAGVMAHVAHMAAYVFPTDRAAWTNSSIDPRYNSVSPRGVARVLSDLDGRWAVPGNGYGAAIERHVRAINQR
jgi:hypothetical protein